MANVVLSGGRYGGVEVDDANFDDAIVEMMEKTEPDLVHIYRLTEDKLQAVFVEIRPRKK